VWLVDFGLARAAASGGARVMMAGGKTVAAGTPGYTPLEQRLMQPSTQSDIYALGATMHHLLSGRDPRDRFSSFPELDIHLLRSLAAFSPLTEVRPDVSPTLENLVARCLDADQARRPSAEQLKIELDRLAPTGSRFFELVRRWSPTVGELLGTALATFVRMLFGRPANPRARHWSPPGPSQPPRAAGGSGQRQSMPCLYCRGQGVTPNGRTCPICGGSGHW
jgi:serine/threonine protein kinase